MTRLDRIAELLLAALHERVGPAHGSAVHVRRAHGGGVEREVGA